MRNRSYYLLALLLIFMVVGTSCTVFKNRASRTYPIIVANPTSVERADELVVLSREMIETKTGEIPEGGFIKITTTDNQQLIVQFDDLDKDKQWDEAAFQYTFAPLEKVQFFLSRSNTLYNSTVTRAHVRMRKKLTNNSFGPLLDSVTIPGNTPPTDFTKQKLPPYLTEGPAWENDKVGFRIYMDTRNTKDIFGKRTQRMMMDTVGTNPENTYHHLADWGMDILAVGKSLGAGSLAFSVPTSDGSDTLVRLGGSNVEGITYEKVADGPVRAIFRMHYKNFKLLENAPPVNVTEEISIWGGTYFYESKVTISGSPAGTKLVTGIVNLKSKTSHQLTADSAKALYTFDTQSENNDLLGMAVMVAEPSFSSFGKTPNAGSDVLNTYTVTIPLTIQPATFRFYAGWERSDLLFTREENFKTYLENEAKKYSSKLLINFK